MRIECVLSAEKNKKLPIDSKRKKSTLSVEMNANLWFQNGLFDFMTRSAYSRSKKQAGKQASFPEFGH